MCITKNMKKPFIVKVKNKPNKSFTKLSTAKDYALELDPDDNPILWDGKRNITHEELMRESMEETINLSLKIMGI